MKKWNFIFLTFVMGLTQYKILKKLKQREINYKDDIIAKNDAIIKLYSKWLKKKSKGADLDQYLKKNNYHHIAIYGMGSVGENIFEELKSTDINVDFVIEKNVYYKCEDIDVYVPCRNLPQVDAIIVTAVCYFNEIEKILMKKVSCPIISFEDIINTM